jgi:hypothetical protein
MGMKREDIIKASFEYKREIELIEGNFQNNINLSSVAGAFREGVGWFIDYVWYDKKVKPKVGEFIVCIHEKGKLMGILQEDQVFISSRPGCILYRFSETIQWAYLNDLLGLMEG